MLPKIILCIISDYYAVNQVKQRRSARNDNRGVKKASDHEYNFRCNCGRRFTYDYDYKRHVKTECGRTFQCPLCPTTTTIKCNLLRHQKTVHKNMYWLQ